MSSKDDQDMGWTEKQVHAHVWSNYSEYFRWMMDHPKFKALLRIVGYDEHGQSETVKHYGKTLLYMVLEKCVEKYPAYSKKELVPLDNYVFESIKNKIIDEIRKHEIKIQIYEDIDDDDEETLDTKAQYAIAVIVVYKMSQEKDSRIRFSNYNCVILLMWYAEKMSQKEIAEVTGRDLSRTSQIVKAFEELLEALAEHNVVRFKQEHYYGLQELCRYYAACVPAYLRR